MEYFSMGFFGGFFLGAYVVYSMKKNEMELMEEYIKELEAKDGSCKHSCS